MKTLILKSLNRLRLRESNKALCRNLKENPNAQGNQLKMQSERLRVQTLLEDCKTEMLGAGGFANLVSLVDSERRDQELLLEVKKKEREATACVKILEGELQVLIIIRRKNFYI